MSKEEEQIAGIIGKKIEKLRKDHPVYEEIGPLHAYSDLLVGFYAMKIGQFCAFYGISPHELLEWEDE